MVFMMDKVRKIASYIPGVKDGKKAQQPDKDKAERLPRDKSIHPVKDKESPGEQ